jgi:hypothetical protein
MRKVKKFLQTTNEEMIFIYGADDPWSAPAVDLPNRPNFLKVIKEGGSHRARVNNLPDAQKKLVHDKLGEWMEVNIKE